MGQKGRVLILALTPYKLEPVELQTGVEPLNQEANECLKNQEVGTVDMSHCLCVEAPSLSFVNDFGSRVVTLSDDVSEFPGSTMLGSRKHSRQQGQFVVCPQFTFEWVNDPSERARRRNNGNRDDNDTSCTGILLCSMYLLLSQPLKFTWSARELTCR